jgi:hypothetical protein
LCLPRRLGGERESVVSIARSVVKRRRAGGLEDQPSAFRWRGDSRRPADRVKAPRRAQFTALGMPCFRTEVLFQGRGGALSSLGLECLLQTCRRRTALRERRLLIAPSESQLNRRANLRCNACSPGHGIGVRGLGVLEYRNPQRISPTFTFGFTRPSGLNESIHSGRYDLSSVVIEIP